MYFPARLLLLGLFSVFLFRPLSLCAQNVVINEFMASNGRTIADEDGDFEDWIELYNAGLEPVNLEGWGLTDDLDDPFQWIFPDVTIEPGGFLLVFASGKDRRVSVPGGGVNWYTALETATAQQAAGIWLFDEEEGETAQDRSGSANHGIIHGAVRVQDDELGSALRFIRTEQQYVEMSNTLSLQTTNSMTISMWIKPASLPGRQTVWDKAYGGEGSITLESTGRLNYYWGISGGNAHPYQGIGSVGVLQINTWTHLTMIRCLDRKIVRWYFDGELLRTTPAEFPYAVGSEAPLRIGRGYAGAFDGWIARPMLLPYAADRQLHANFRISSAGEPLQLTRPDGSIADTVDPVALRGDISYGRSPDGADAWFYYDEATPGKANTSTAYAELLAPPTFSHAGGFYTEGFHLQLSAPTDDATIIYTLDGSEPDINNLAGTTYPYKNSYPRNPGDPLGPFLEQHYISLLYSASIAIHDRSHEPDKLTQMSSTVHLNPNYFPSTPVRKGTVVRARLHKPGAIPSTIITQTYFVWSEGNPYNLPVISLSVQEDRLFDYHEGIYTAGADFDTWRMENPDVGGLFPAATTGNFGRRGREWEYPCHIEMYNPGLTLNQSAGFRIHGTSSRRHPIKSMRLYARSAYDENNVFTTDVFGVAVPFSRATDNKTYKRLFLRSTGSFPMETDIVLLGAMHPVYEGVTRILHAIKFINGEYWGITTIRDRFDQYHFGYHYDIDPDNIVIVEARHAAYSLDVGLPSDAETFNQMRSFILDHDMSDKDHFSAAANMLDLRSFVDYHVLFIYSGSLQPERGYWRARVPCDDHFGDGKWRVYTDDYDNVLYNYNFFFNMIRTDPFVMIKSLLDSVDFRNYFINRFADHLNSTFEPSRFESVVAHAFDEVKEYREEDDHRSRRDYYGNSERSRIIAWGYDRPGPLRRHIRDYFGISHDINVTLDRSNASHGHIRINTIEINEDTLGVAEKPYPWTGLYFSGIPVELEALPEEGYRLAGWEVFESEGEPEPMGYFSSAPTIELSLTNDTTIVAVFEPIPFGEQGFLLHEWDFEDEAGFLAPSFTVGGGVLEIELEEYTEIERNDPAQDFATHHLRVNDPLGAKVTFSVPTKGYEEIQLEYLTRRSGQGAGEQTLWYSTNGEDWEKWAKYSVFDAAPQQQTFDFSSEAGVADNMDFAIRITFNEADGGTSGNNRFDDVHVRGVRVDPSKTPPEVEEAPDVQKVIEGGAPATLDLDVVFTGDSLTYSTSSSDTNKVQVSVDGSELMIIPKQRGQAKVVIAADDGHYYPATTMFRVLVYPSAHALTNGAFTFMAWDPNLPDGTYPEHMLFLQSDQSDTALDTPLLYAYTLRPEDYHANDQNSIGFPYNNTGRTRINGLDDGGIAFINTGQNRDLGGALLAVNTTGLSNSWVRWLGGTVLPNSRIYALRLQYRVGLDGPFVDLSDDKGQPIEYVRNGLAGHAEMMPMAALPEAALDKEYVQLLWRYYRVSGGSGPRAQLRLDDILVSPYGVEVATLPAHGGSVSGERLFAMEQSTELTAEPALYYRFLRWAGDVPPDQEESNPLELWLDAPRSVTARFSEDVTENTGTPHWWLAKYGLTNDSFEVEALKLHGANNLPAWKLYVADLDPTDPASALPWLAVEREGEHWAFEMDPTSTGRIYSVQWATNLYEDSWITLTNAPGTGASWIQEATDEPSSLKYFRGRISVFDK